METSRAKSDPVHNLLAARPKPLDSFFSPRAIAVIGATDREESVGRALLENLLHSKFTGKVYPVNPKHSRLLEVECFPSLAALPGPIDLALIATPAAGVPGVVQACVAAGVKGAIILSSGFREIGRSGADLESQVLAAIQGSPLRIVGPNCMGLMRPSFGLNATFATPLALPGKVAFVSQSGALCSSILDWSFKERVGFSAFVSIGAMLDLGWGDFLDYLDSDPETESILLYMESIGQAEAFLSAARQAAVKKPIIVLKAGASPAAAHAAASHTGALVGSDAVLDAAFRRVGVLRVRSISELFLMAEVLAKQPLPSGPHLAIVTNAGGPGVLATDAFSAVGGSLAELSEPTLAKLDQVLPPHWSHGNPIDILGDADPERFGQAVEIAFEDPGSDGVLVILTPQQMTEPTQSAERLIQVKNRQGKPLLASWMGGNEIGAGEDRLNRNKIPTFPYPDNAAQVFQYMWDYSLNLQRLYETPALPTAIDGAAPDRAQVAAILSQARKEGRNLLNEAESKSLLGAYGIPTIPTWIARNETEAVRVAKDIGYPVVLKLYSEQITHKSDVGGVQLNLADEAAVRKAYHDIEENVRAKKGEGFFEGVTVQAMVALKGYELILGSSCDPQIGPVLLFGAGGELVEVLKDQALAIPPLTTNLARALMQQTRIFRALLGIRGRPPVDLDKLDGLLVRFSQLVAEQPEIKEIDINPLLASDAGLLALDARVVLQDPSIPTGRLPRPAIRPYPLQYVTQWKSREGIALTLRPIRPEDEPMVAQFHASLSQDSIYHRYFAPSSLKSRVRHKELAHLCFIDYSRQMVLVAEAHNAEGKSAIVAIGDLKRRSESEGSEFALLVTDAYQRQGLGTEMLRQLLAVAREERWEPVTAVILPDNRVMQEICRRMGFSVQFSPEDGFTIAKWPKS